MNEESSFTNVKMADFVLSTKNMSLYADKIYHVYLGNSNITNISDVIKLSAVLKRADIDTTLIMAYYPITTASDIIIYSKTNHNNWTIVRPQ